MADGWTTVTSADETTLVSLLTEHGGLVTLWNGSNEDIILSVDVTSGTLSFGALRGLIPEDGAALQLAADLEQIFLRTCERVAAWYGYSTDEWSLESRFRTADEIRVVFARHERFVRAGQRPCLLFWINYFGRAYWTCIDGLALTNVGQIEEAKDGIVIRTDGRPPKVEVLVLDH